MASVIRSRKRELTQLTPVISLPCDVVPYLFQYNCSIWGKCVNHVDFKIDMALEHNIFSAILNALFHAPCYVRFIVLSSQS